MRSFICPNPTPLQQGHLQRYLCSWRHAAAGSPGQLGSDYLQCRAESIPTRTLAMNQDPGDPSVPGT